MVSVRVQKMPLLNHSSRWLVFKHLHSLSLPPFSLPPSVLPPSVLPLSLRSPSLPGWWSPKRGGVLLRGRLVETAVDEVPGERRTRQLQISEGIPQTFRTHHEEKRVNFSLSQTFQKFLCTYIHTYVQKKKKNKKKRKNTLVP